MKTTTTQITLSDLVESRYNYSNNLVVGFNENDNNPFHKLYQDCVSGKIHSDNKQKIMAGSYSYLGMGDNLRVQEAVKKTIEQYGVSSQGSRVLTGSTQVHRDLETGLASFIGGEDSILFPTGWSTNFSTINALFGPGDTIINDLKNHNSIQIGVHTSGAKTVTFNAERPSTLERAFKKAEGATLVVIDSIFSMDGTIAPLPEILEVCKRNDAYLMVDEAHSLGVLGKTGRGITEHFGIDPKEIDLLMGTCSKALAGSGGYIVAKKEIIEFLRYRANGYIFSGAVPAYTAASSLESIRVLDENPELVTELQNRYTYFRKNLEGLGLKIIGDNTPIVPVIYPNEDAAVEATQHMWDNGVFIVPAMYPAVSRKTPRLRFSITLNHSYEDLDYIIKTLQDIRPNEGLIDLTD